MFSCIALPKLNKELYLAENIVCHITCYITICKSEKNQNQALPKSLCTCQGSIWEPFAVCTVLYQLGPTLPMVPGPGSSVGGIYNDVSWSFLGKSVLSAAFSCENRSMALRQNICYITCYITCCTMVI